MLPPPPPKRQAYTALPAEVVEESIQPPPPSYKPRPPPPPPPPRREIKSLEDGTSSVTNVNPTSTQTVKVSKHILEESKNKSTNPFDDLSEDEGQPLRGGSVMRMKFTLPKTALSLPSSGTLMPGEPESLIYHKNNFSEPWFVIFLIIHTVQFIMMLSAANEQLSSGAFAVIVLLVVVVIILVLLSRWYTRKSRLSSAKNVEMRNGVCTPDDEADDIDDRAIYCLIVACVLEGIAYAIFAATVAGRSSELNKSGFYTQDTILQILRFASITLLALHRIIRPANRIDPMRTILELEVVSVCWDAIDGSTIFELLDDSTLADTTANAARALMVIWYLSVGARIGLMLIAHLKPTSPIYPLFVTYPLQLAKQMTVDRTLQAVRLRSIVIMIMAGADFYAAILRIVLWSNDQLDSLQQEMMLKNFFFLISFGMAYAKYSSTSSRKWNTRIFDLKYFTIHLPKRATQLRILRWLFTIFYLIISVSLTAILVDTTSASTKWIVNLVFDLILLVIFFVYCQNIHIKSERNDTSWLIFPREKFLAFPSTLAIGLGSAMLCSLLFARIPGIYYHFNDLSETGDDYNEALMCVSLAVIPIAFYNLYWSTGYMLFRKEFTAVPNNYHGIHDPTIKLIATATMTEGALDVLSCATLMELAANDLPASVNGAIVLFCLLEIINGCQCFALQVTLSGGHDDTPLDLVRWNAYLRTFRVLIDSGAIVLRVVLWIKYNAVSSVFLVKNIYNLIHTVTQIERWKSVTHYPKETLFSEFVSPYEWYGYTREQWKKATTETIAAQLRSEQKALLKGLFVRRKEILLRDF